MLGDLIHPMTSKKSKYIQKHPKASKDIQKHPKISKNIQRHPKTSKNIQRHQKISKDVQRHQNTLCIRNAWSPHPSAGKSPECCDLRSCEPHFYSLQHFLPLYHHRHHQARIFGHLNTVHRILGSPTLFFTYCTYCSQFCI